MKFTYVIMQKPLGERRFFAWNDETDRVVHAEEKALLYKPYKTLLKYYEGQGFKEVQRQGWEGVKLDERVKDMLKLHKETLQEKADREHKDSKDLMSKEDTA